MIVKSEYIKNEIKGKSFSDKKQRKYAMHLTYIEKFLLDTPTNMGDGMYFHYLMEEFPKECKAIFLELDPERYKRFVGTMQIDAALWPELKKRLYGVQDKQRAKEEAELKTFWLKCGGIA